MARELRGALAHLRHRAGRRLQRLRPERLDRVDHRDARLRRIERREDAFELGFRQQAQGTAHCSRLQREAPRAERDLLRRLLAADVERRQVGGNGVQRLEEQSRLADAGIAAEQRHLSRDQPAAECAVELGLTARDALELLRVDRFQRHGFRRLRGVAMRRALLHRGLAERADRGARRTGAEPLQCRGAAFCTDVGGLGLRHQATSSTGTRDASAHSSS